jgi:hypothetical protein
VTDGTHTAHIALVGNYTTSHFVVAADSGAGTLIHDPAGPPGPSTAAVTTLAFVQAAAALGATAPGSLMTPGPMPAHAAMLFAAGRGGQIS